MMINCPKDDFIKMATIMITIAIFSPLLRIIRFRTRDHVHFSSRRAPNATAVKRISTIIRCAKSATAIPTESYPPLLVADL